LHDRIQGHHLLSLSLLPSVDAQLTEFACDQKKSSNERLLAVKLLNMWYEGGSNRGSDNSAREDNNIGTAEKGEEAKENDAEDERDAEVVQNETCFVATVGQLLTASIQIRLAPIEKYPFNEGSISEDDSEVADEALVINLPVKVEDHFATIFQAVY